MEERRINEGGREKERGSKERQMYLFRIIYRDKRDKKKKKREREKEKKRRALVVCSCEKSSLWLCRGSFTQTVELFGGLLKGKILGHQSQLQA